MKEDDIIDAAVPAVMRLIAAGASWYFICSILGLSFFSPFIASYAIAVLGGEIGAMWIRGELNR